MYAKRSVLRRAYALRTAGVCLLGLASAAMVRADDADEHQTFVRVVTRWNDASGCSGSTRSSWDNMLRAWYNEMDDQGWTPSGFYANGDINDHDYADPDVVVWGEDNLWGNADSGDAFMAGFHGKDADGAARWYGKVRVDASGGAAGGGDCYAEQEHIRLGDTDLEFLHLSSCESMNEESWWPEWSEAFVGLHQIDGFHGLMWISTSYNDRYRDFADDGFEIGLADAWVDNHYDPAHWYEWWQDYDHCPVARGIGTDEANCDRRLSRERYNNEYSDLSAADIGYDGAIYIDGCDPKSADPI